MNCPICGGWIERDHWDEGYQCGLCARAVEWNGAGAFRLVAIPPTPAIVRDKPFRRGPVLGGERVHDRGPQ